MLGIVWRFQIPGILLTEKHMSESRMTVSINVKDFSRGLKPLIHSGRDYKRYLDTEDGISPLFFPPSEEFIKWNSYYHDELGITTEDPEIIVKMHDKRMKKEMALLEYMKGIHTVNVYGEGELVILSYGSTTMSVREALKVGNISAMVVQPIYLRPLPRWELERYKGDDIIVVEQSSTAQFATFLREKAGIDPRAVIKKYDGRPFEPVKLAGMIKEVM
jgi:2-oxoglutarate ferredoxin oxidoreductase subunit alpha